MSTQPHPAPLHVLRLDASARDTDSVSRRLGDALLARLDRHPGGISLTHRDLANNPPPFVDASWVQASFTETAQRTPAQREALAVSDSLVQELNNADVLVIGLPLYNFGVPAVLKAWVDMVARARVTFRYTEQGVEGLLKGKRAYLLAVSGGVPMGSAVDFASTYMRHILGFLGINEVELIAADGLNQRGETAIDEALAAIDALSLSSLASAA